MSQDDRREDYVLDPTQYAYVLDATQGTVKCSVGPCRLDLAEAKDRPVFFDGGEFKRCKILGDAIHVFPVAKDGDYIVLENPSQGDAHPPAGRGTTAVDLNVGRQVVVPGPVTFPLWPGQRATVIPGHTIRSNQYLVARVFNEADAQQNWGQQGVVKPSTEEKDEKLTPPDTSVVSALGIKPTDLTVGKEIVIKGTDVSFFIPPTGIEVIPEGNKYVRDAVTLERLEYCILVDEDGNKRFERGPQVVFPKPTEQFVRDQGGTSRKFRAIELNEISGLYIKVIADHEEGDQEYYEGDELFVTGADQRLYWPRAEHAIIKYGDQERHFAVAVPAGEARYILSRLSGEINTRKGPAMELLDPRKEVFVRRVLSAQTVQLWFPNNQEALVYNKQLGQLREGSSDFARERSVRGSEGVGGLRSLMAAMNYVGDVGQEVSSAYAASERAVSEVAGDKIQRKEKFTPPRSIHLDTKYDGAVLINVWTGFAVQVISKTGKREVVVGPSPRVLDYDETLEVMSLSTGTPKGFKNPIRTVYLRVTNNRVSDEVMVETADLVKVKLRLSYRMNFECDTEKWFSVENYVGLLTERIRSLLKGRIKQMKVRVFMADSVSIVRDIILGRPTALMSEDDEAVELTPIGRPGLSFPENNMRVYDVEVLDVTVGDLRVAELLANAQERIVMNEIDLDAKEQELGITQRIEEINQQVSEARHVTALKIITLDEEHRKCVAQHNLAQIVDALREAEEDQKVRMAHEDITDMEARRTVERRQATIDQGLAETEKQQAMAIELHQKRGEVLVKAVEAIKPDLIAAIQTGADVNVTKSIVDKLTPLATLRGEGVSETFKALMQGTVLSDIVDRLGGNGDGTGFGRHGLSQEAQLKEQE